ncbi:MAG: hypothetical protein AB1427_15495 [Thermodesulfobacteriota bacterium]
MKKQFHLKQIGILCCIALITMSAIAATALSVSGDSGAFEEIWLKLWKKDGRVVDLRFQINRIGASDRIAPGGLPLETYPFQFDLSEIGGASADDITGIVYGYRITPDGRTDSPLMVRWWIVIKDQIDLRDPAPPRYPLTLKLRVWDSAGVEFNPNEQQATLFEKNGIVAESLIIHPKKG